MGCCVNPEFNSTVILPMLGRGDVIRLTLLDKGMCEQAHLGGLLGPKVVATATLRAGEDVDPFIPMEVSSACKPGLGNPHLKLTVSWEWYSALDPAQPAAGTVSARVEAWQSLQSQQAMTPASAPSLMEAAPQELGVGALGSSVGALGSSDSSTLGSFSIVEIERWNRDFARNTSSPFYVDPAILFWAKPNQILQSLYKLQQKGEKGPFPNDGLRHYTCFACGYQMEIRDWDKQLLWGPVDTTQLPSLLDKVLKPMQRLAAEEENPYWTWAVPMLVKFMENLKARCMQCNAVQWHVKQCSVM